MASLIVLFLALLAYALITTDPLAFFIGISFIIKVALVLPLIFIPLEVVTTYLLAKAIRFKEPGTFDLIYQSLILVTALFFIPRLMYYNLIGFSC
jgi:hypothetical protein